MIHVGGVIFAISFGILLYGVTKRSKLRKEFRYWLFLIGIVNFSLLMVSFFGGYTSFRRIVIYLLMGLLWILWGLMKVVSECYEIKTIKNEQSENYEKLIYEKTKNIRNAVIACIIFLIWIIYSIVYDQVSLL
ncbi:hypothetical protein [Veillonella agrestimuris]|uniref:hypothetical protein n=1 Tax=Veillonella agrestimuris TaxID=2941340 RepID=UPI00203FED89|nr:hypothetical protein [Veillonella agrestimuris]